MTRPAIGVSYLDSSQAKTLGISQGILVLDAPIDSPAAVAGVIGTRRTSQGDIVLGDIIIGMDSDVIEQESDLFKAIEKHHVGDKVQLKILRQWDNVDDKDTHNSGKSSDKGYTRLGEKIVREPVEMVLTVQLAEAIPRK